LRRVCGSTRVFSRVTPASVMLPEATVRFTSPVPARSRKEIKMAKIKLEGTVTLVMSLEEAIELYEAVGELPAEACYEVYVALDEALARRIRR